MIALEQQRAWELMTLQEADYLKIEGVSCKLCPYRVQD